MKQQDFVTEQGTCFHQAAELVKKIIPGVDTNSLAEVSNKLLNK